MHDLSEMMIVGVCGKVCTPAIGIGRRQATNNRSHIDFCSTFHSIVLKVSVD